MFLFSQIQDAGFVISAHEEKTLTEAEAQDFYQHKSSEVNDVITTANLVFIG